MALAFLLAALLGAATCGGRTPAVQTGAASDSLRTAAAAESALATAAPKLQWWIERWSRFVPGFTLDSLRLVAVRPLPAAEHGVSVRWEGEQDRELFGEPSPDSSFVFYPDLYRSYYGGEIELHPEPDSEAFLVDARRDSGTTLEHCGTLCLFERPVWIGSKAVVLTQLMEDWEDSSRGWGELVLFDLDRRTRTDFRTPEIRNLAEVRQITRDELYAYYRERVATFHARRSVKPS